jgi:hypothetical protein
LGEEKNVTTKNGSIFQKEVCVCGREWGGRGELQEDFIIDVYKRSLKEKKIVYKTQTPILNADISFL